MGLDPSREREGFKAQVNTIPSCKADLCLKAVKEQGSSSLSPTEGILSGCWNPVGDGDDWTPLFARAFKDWEIDLVERLLQKIHAFRVQREEEDRVIWTASNDGAFSVKSLYSMLEWGGSSMFPSERIWRVRVPPKVAFFAWEASWVKATLLGWNGVFVGKRRKRAWQMAHLCIFWHSLSLVDEALVAEAALFQGMNEGDKRRIIKSMIRSYSADLVCLKETKMQQMNDSLPGEEFGCGEVFGLGGQWRLGVKGYLGSLGQSGFGAY
ncbi:hypothetical protein CK203_072483 [Vitis vinifera]|uniref:Reverse transcriptase zinc-binding domain-containing protein n=1 Tax=Vitis vinifera TaxID=29760 RepID=A0A438F947_VITVI|nr:hypothetical protein CK203_072483 [Vitis vinifera]